MEFQYRYVGFAQYYICIYICGLLWQESKQLQPNTAALYYSNPKKTVELSFLVGQSRVLNTKDWSRWDWNAIHHIVKGPLQVGLDWIVVNMLLLLLQPIRTHSSPLCTVPGLGQSFPHIFLECMFVPPLYPRALRWRSIISE